MLISRHSLSLQRTEGHTAHGVRSIVTDAGLCAGAGAHLGVASSSIRDLFCTNCFTLHLSTGPSTARHMHQQLHWGTQGVAPPTHSAMMMSFDLSIRRRSGDTCIKSFDCHSLQLPVSRFIDICAKTVFKEKMP